MIEGRPLTDWERFAIARARLKDAITREMIAPLALVLALPVRFRTRIWLLDLEIGEARLCFFALEINRSASYLSILAFGRRPGEECTALFSIGWHDDSFTWDRGIKRLTISLFWFAKYFTFGKVRGERFGSLRKGYKEGRPLK